MGKGMAEGGGAANPMIVGMGMGMAGQVVAAPGQAPYPDARGPELRRCPTAGAGYPAAVPSAPAAAAGAAHRRTERRHPPTVECPSCPARSGKWPRFCDSCGAKMQAQCAELPS